MTWKCLCGYHPSLPGIPSDNRNDNPECPVHHVENARPERLDVEVTCEVYDDSFTVDDWYQGEDMTGLTSEQFAKDFTFREFVEGITLSVRVRVDDQDWAEVRE